MSDVICGPSNALQQFKQQTSLDRTLQQDRLSTRQSPAQGFRSRDPLAGRLDADFEAFQAGVALPDLPIHQQTRLPNVFAAPSQPPSWANDFQRLQISPPSIAQQHAGAISTGNAPWAQGFREHISSSAPRMQSSNHSPQAFQHMARYGMSGIQDSYQTSFAPTVLSKGKEAVLEDFDDAAFERAFDQASQALLEEPEIIVEGTDSQLPAYESGASTANYPGDSASYMDQSQVMDSMAQYGDAQALEDATRAGVLDQVEDVPMVEQVNDVLEQDEQPQSDTQADDDALAATARDLLEKVQHNQTDKFKNSQFLTLMRKLRDREMRVEGDQMVETVRLAHDSTYGSTTSSPAFPSSNNPTPEHSAHPRFSNENDHDFDHWESPYH